MPSPPALLIAAFRAAEMQKVNGKDLPRLEPIAALLEGDGFDAEAVRVLTAWSNTEHVWAPPPKPMPDDGRPTARAWAWLVSGWEIDYPAIARGANVSNSTARQKVELLVGNRLIYPDGEMSAGARVALKNLVASRIKGQKRKPKADEDAN